METNRMSIIVKSILEWTQLGLTIPIWSLKMIYNTS